jgi:N-acetylmuramoyl-L-alanine amidase
MGTPSHYCWLDYFAMSSLTFAIKKRQFRPKGCTMALRFQMKKSLLALLPWMVTVAAAQQDGPFPAEVVFTHYGTSPARAWQIELDCFVPVEAVKDWGWKAEVGRYSVTFDADGRSFSVPYRVQAGTNIFSMATAAKKMGANGEWKPGSRTFVVFGVIRNITFADGIFKVDSTLPAKPKATTLAHPDRLVLDFDGMRLDSRLASRLPEGVSAAAHGPFGTRITVQTEKPVALAANQIPSSRLFILNLNGIPEKPRGTSDEIATPLPGNQTAVDPITDPGSQGGSEPPISTQPPVEVPPIPTGPKTASARPPVLRREVGNKATVVIDYSGALSSSPQIRRPEMDLLELVLPGMTYSGEPTVSLPTKMIEGVTIEQGAVATILRFKMARPLGVELSLVKGAVALIFTQPKVGDGRLAGKTIVVDPGHGGHDSGARAPDKSVNEKSLTLAISMKLADELTAQGATVIMTRKTDVFIPLKERPMMGNRTGADFFVSIHINSNKVANSTSGQITFYHKSDPVGQLLAECIQQEMAKVSGIKSIGAWSDGRIYDSGFAVLRHATMPAVLVECGFINHRTDRSKMVTEEFQSNMAKAIVQGIKVFLGDVEK